VVPLAAPVTAPHEGSGARSTSAWAKPAAWVSGGVALAGAGVFVGFGLASQSEYDSVKKLCESPCANNSTAKSWSQTGKTEQLVANVGAIVGGAAAVAAVTFVILSVSGASPSGPARGGTEPSVLLGLGSAAVSVPF